MYLKVSFKIFPKTYTPTQGSVKEVSLAHAEKINILSKAGSITLFTFSPMRFLVMKNYVLSHKCLP